MLPGQTIGIGIIAMVVLTELFQVLSRDGHQVSLLPRVTI